MASKYRTIYVMPKVATLDIDSQRQRFRHPAMLYKGATYVALREMLAVLEQRYGLRFDVQYVGKNQIEVTRLSDSPSAHTPRSFDALFAQGLKAMWDGRVQNAVEAFRRAEAFGGADAEDARGLARWLSEEANGIVRFHWWNIPMRTRVFVDDMEVQRGAVLTATSIGLHRFRLVGDDNIVVYDQRSGSSPTILSLSRWFPAYAPIRIEAATFIAIQKQGAAPGERGLFASDYQGEVTR